MIARLAAVTLLTALATVGSASAQDRGYPYSGILYDVMASRVLSVRCEPPVDGEMTCAFVEVTVDPGSDAPIPASSLPDEGDCAGLPALAAAFVDGVPPPGADTESFAARFAHQPAAQKADTAELVGALRSFCSKEPGAQDRLAALLQDRARRTCVLTVATYKLIFEKDAAATRWETVSAPAADACGTVNAGTFEQPAGARPSAPWNYRLSLRPTGAGPGCPAAVTDHLYVNEPADIYAGCDYLRFRN